MQWVKRSNGVDLDKKRKKCLEEWDELAKKARELEAATRKLAKKVVKRSNGYLPREK
jgi:hypothetical protein